jgi:hypothetical protein
MKKVVVGLAGAVGLVIMGSIGMMSMNPMGIAQAAEKGQRPAAQRAPPQQRAAPRQRAAFAGRPPWAPPQALLLSPEQMRVVYAGVPKDRARAELRIRLGLGAEIPRSVALFAFPDAVIAQVPQVAPFRYIVVEDDVVIVDPADYEIAMVISE